MLPPNGQYYIIHNDTKLRSGYKTKPLTASMSSFCDEMHALALFRSNC
jgi:hypothetical protein